eukprot:3730815-Rhodomonas_salina.1
MHRTLRMPVPASTSSPSRETDPSSFWPPTTHAWGKPRSALVFLSRADLLHHGALTPLHMWHSYPYMNGRLHLGHAFSLYSLPSQPDSSPHHVLACPRSSTPSSTSALSHTITYSRRHKICDAGRALCDDVRLRCQDQGRIRSRLPADEGSQVPVALR